MEKLFTIIESLSFKDPLDKKFKDHPLINDKLFTNCRECHIEPDWLLVYKYEEDKLILILIATGSHSNILK